MTQIEFAKKHKISPLINRVASLERSSSALISKLLREGKAVVPNNRLRRIKKPCAIGKGLRTKINANIGTSTDKSQVSDELRKMEVCVKYGADTVMDLSVGGDLRQIRKKILRLSPVPVGTVPIYEIAVNAQKEKGDFLKFTAGEIFDVLESQAKDGVDFFTIHAGVTRQSLGALKKHKRVLDIVSRGGAILAAWMSRNKKENPLYEEFDRVLDIAYHYDITLSLGDGMRPGSILDATDPAQLSELNILGELAGRCRKKNVQVMIEGPGHVPLNQIHKNVLLEKQICKGAPFYVLGPLVTDVAAGYDHISSAIGGALAASYGADFLCYVTPSEHLRHPSVEDAREGVVAYRIAAHAADIAKGIKSELEWDRDMSIARKARDWKKQIALSVDPEKAGRYRSSSKPHLFDVCTMCGKYCSIKLMEECMRA
ncbi:MAG: phosphomethylpyrimidine synthase ThiC [Candidatus Omnitrophica bacterium]|nr:phosphomethylpyrimidine synthase ThiC [Candidatus Omnitrophota bacterium]MDD5552758.1 phosphomethylpyrimidine synthase ThiC [Candidatus Omnitrophota bacterium]